jgi:hypothetical protein
MSREIWPDFLKVIRETSAVGDMFRKDHLHGERIVSGSEPLPEQFPPD